MKKKKREENSQLEMLEGAKLIGAGAATIASAGAVVVGSVIVSIVTDTGSLISSFFCLRNAYAYQKD